MPELIAATDIDTQIRVSRTVDAPRELVWKMVTQAEHIKHWWSPRGFSIPICTIDLRVGGNWHYAMQDDSDGTKHWSIATYEEIVPVERLKYRDAFSNENAERFPPETTVTIVFVDEGEQTTLNSVIECDSKEHRDQLVEMGMLEGMSEGFDKLDEYLPSMKTERDAIISREFDAPPAVVFRAWTDPDQVQQWWGPEGFHCETQHIDIREGGEWRFVMKGMGQEWPNLIRYHRIVPNERIEYEVGDGIAAEPEFTGVATFEDLGGRTRLTMRMTFPTAEARDAVAAFGAIELGYSTLAKLARLLEA